MKKRIVCGILAAACLLGGARALAAGGSGESLVSLSYLNDVFFPSLVNTMGTRAAEDTREVYAQAETRLDELGNRYLAELAGVDGADGWSYSDTILVRQVKRGDVATVATGSTVLWIVGTAVAEAGLVDVTAGSELAAGGQLTAGHRYLSAEENSPVKVTVLSDAAQIALEGIWTVSESDENVTGFVDLVKNWNWFYDAMRYAVEHGLFNGTSPAEISPYGQMNRAMLATVLYRMEGCPGVTGAAIFPDVPAGEWYAAGVEWAARAGVVNGMDNGTFAPFSSVTREQLAVMLYRYAVNYLHLEVSNSLDLSVFPDSGRVSSWAWDAMAWAVSAGIITGSDGSLLPYNQTNRAEVATMLQRFQYWAGRL